MHVKKIVELSVCVCVCVCSNTEDNFTCKFVAEHQ